MPYNPFDTRYPIPDTRYPIPAQKYAALSAAYFCATSLQIPQTRGHTAFDFQISSIILFIAAARFYASSFVGAAGETRGSIAFITHIQTYIPVPAQTRGHTVFNFQISSIILFIVPARFYVRIACNFSTYIYSVLAGG